MPNLSMFIPITKVDAVQRLVYGLATAESLDRQGEICDYATTKPFYEKWSNDIAKASDGKSLGNVRSMHGSVAAGKITHLTFNDPARQIELCAKIIDDTEWSKVLEGVYTGFSQGGAYVKRWTDERGRQRYTADPCEVSLVDLPCLPESTFQMIKGNGLVEERPFANGRDGESNDECEQVWRSRRDGSQFGSQEDVRKYHQHLDAQAAAAGAAASAFKTIGTICETLEEHNEPIVNEESAMAKEFAKVKAERDALKNALDKMQPQLEEILRRVKKIEQQPVALPYAGQPRTVSKAQDGHTRSIAETDVLDVFKQAQRNPRLTPLTW